jgi:8-oxo-dGTP pyrophosphatase MutT (NUDIX family)
VVRGEDEVLLISTRGGRRWQLPKGHLEAGETPEEAAVREICEETGVTGRLVRPLGVLEYDFRDRTGRRIIKRVDYFLLRYEDGSAADYDPVEVSGARWFGWREAIRRLTFDNERGLVESAFLRGVEES